jgi:hypothetical protein
MSLEFTVLFVISNFSSLKKEKFLVIGRRQTGDELGT